jgi:hypothetical protein
MKALVICDDYWHPARTVRNGLAPLAAAGVASTGSRIALIGRRNACRIRWW